MFYGWLSASRPPVSHIEFVSLARRLRVLALSEVRRLGVRVALPGVWKRGCALERRSVMVRSAASTLATVLMLGAVSTAKGEDVSALGNSEFNSFNSALPGLPENWSDLPFQLRVNESTLYNSNILNTPKFTGSASQNPLQALVAGQPLSGLESVSDYTLSTKANWGSQQFFAHGSYGFYRYVDHTYLNEAHNSVDAGVNWVYTSKCSGTLIASEITAPTTP